MTTPHNDVIVAGAGVAGLSAALALSNAGEIGRASCRERVFLSV